MQESKIKAKRINFREERYKIMGNSIYDRDGNKVGEIISPTDNDEYEYKYRGNTFGQNIIIWLGVVGVFAVVFLIIYGLLHLAVN